MGRQDYVEKYQERNRIKELVVKKLVEDLEAEAERLGQDLSDWRPEQIVRFTLNRTTYHT